MVNTRGRVSGHTTAGVTTAAASAGRAASDAAHASLLAASATKLSSRGKLRSVSSANHE